MKSGPPSTFSVIFNDESIGKAIRIGDCMPEFSIEFFDSRGSIAAVTGDISITMMCPELTVSCDEIADSWDFGVSQSVLRRFPVFTSYFCASDAVIFHNSA